MTLARRFLTLCLVLMLLPWGAWLRAAEAATPASPVPASPVPLAQAAQPAQAPRAAPLPHRCRTATLPGSVCGLAIAYEELTLPSAPDGTTDAVTRDEALMPAEWDGPVAIPPPRLN